MSSLWLDVRYALRMMAKTPALTSVLVITLALGIGASTTIFSVVNSVVLKPLPYKEPGKLVRVYTEFHAPGFELPKFWVSPPEFDELRRECQSCELVAAWAPRTASLSGGDRPVRVEATYASAELLPLLGVQPMLGRWFDAGEDKPDAEPDVIVLGHGLWQRSFGSDPSIIGRKIQLNAQPVTVIGVMPEGFEFLEHQEAWIPSHLKSTPNNRGSHSLSVVVRLKPDATFASFREELVNLTANWGRRRVPNFHTVGPDNPYVPRHSVIAEPFQEDMVGSLSTTLWLLQGAVLFVLLISIVNVANLLLARSETRTREVAVRHALGASRRRLARQFITESLMLGILGGGLGILVAVWAVDGVTALIPRSAPRANEIHLDGAAVAFAVVCSTVAALLFGLAPIVHARRTDLHGALKDGSPKVTGSKARLRARRVLVISEIALATVLVIGCTVMVRSFIRLQQVQLGFQPDHLLTFGVNIPQKSYPGVTGDVFWHRLEDRMRALPGVSYATLVFGLPPDRPINANDMSFPGRPKNKPGDPPWNVDFWQFVGDDAIETLGARIVRGRGFTREDNTYTAPLVAVVNERFANIWWPGEDPIGKKINITPWDKNQDDHQSETIVGVVADMKTSGIDKPAGTEVWMPFYQTTYLSDPGESNFSAQVVIRTTGDPRDVIPSVQRAVADIDPSVPLYKIRTMDDVMWDAVARPRFLTFLLTCFAGIALLLAAVGIYGVMAHTVAQRTHEIGLRVALGAQPKQVRAMVLRQAGLLVAVGVGVGLGSAIVLQWLLDSSLKGLFYGAELSQPVLLGGVAVVVTLAALLATWVPVRRATNVQPTVALRAE